MPSGSTFSKATVQTKLVRTIYEGQEMDMYVHLFEEPSAQSQSMGAPLDKKC